MVRAAGNSNRIADCADRCRTVKLCRCGIPQDDNGFHELDPPGQYIQRSHQGNISVLYFLCTDLLPVQAKHPGRSEGSQKG